MAGRRVRRTPRRSPLEPSQNGLIIIVASSPPVYLRSPVAVALDVADLAVVGGGADWRALLAGHRPALHLRNLLANLTRFRLDSSYLGTSSLVAPYLSGDVPAVLPGHLVAHLLGHLLAHLSRNLFALLARHLHHPTNQSRSQWSRDPSSANPRPPGCTPGAAPGWARRGTPGAPPARTPAGGSGGTPAAQPCCTPHAAPRCNTTQSQ